MKLTIIVDDSSVGVDGEFLSPINLSRLGGAIHAVQWYGSYGEVEYKPRLENNVLVKPANVVITDVTPYSFAVDAWHAAKAESALADAAHQIPITKA